MQSRKHKQHRTPIDFKFRFQASTDSPYWELIRYFQAKEADFSVRELILWASVAYWQPLAEKYLGESSEEELKQSARNSIYRLEQHINYLREVFDLELPQQQLPSLASIANQPESGHRKVKKNSLDELASREDDRLITRMFQ